MNTMSTSTQVRRLIAISILGALALGFTGVSAANDSGARTTTVKYGDLNLSDPQGAAALYGRIIKAARAVCDSSDESPWAMVAADHCVKRAVAEAVTNVGQPQLIAVYNAKNPELLPLTVATALNR